MKNGQPKHSKTKNQEKPSWSWIAFFPNRKWSFQPKTCSIKIFRNFFNNFWENWEFSREFIPCSRIFQSLASSIENSGILGNFLEFWEFPRISFRNLSTWPASRYVLVGFQRFRRFSSIWSIWSISSQIASCDPLLERKKLIIDFNNANWSRSPMTPIWQNQQLKTRNNLISVQITLIYLAKQTDFSRKWSWLTFVQCHTMTFLTFFFSP